jgi:hypothetical protein
MAMSPNVCMLEIHFGFSFTFKFLSCTDNPAQCAHSPFRSGMVILAAFSMDLVLPNKVANAHYTLPFCCGVPGAVKSNLMWKSGKSNCEKPYSLQNYPDVYF